MRNEKGQVQEAKSLLAIIIMIAIGIFTVFTLTSEGGFESLNLSVNGEGTDSGTIQTSPKEAVVSSDYDVSEEVEVTWFVNGEVVKKENISGTGSFELDVSSYAKTGKNTLEVVVS